MDKVFCSKLPISRQLNDTLRWSSIRCRQIKYLLACVVVVVAFPSFGQVVNATLIVDKIRLEPIKEKLHLKNREKNGASNIRYEFDVPGTPKQSVGSFEIHGRHQNDADKVVISCHRFGNEGHGIMQENPTTVCGKIYENLLSTIVDRPGPVIAYLMGAAKQMGGDYSMSKAQIQDFIFQYGNDGILIVRRASRTIP